MHLDFFFFTGKSIITSCKGKKKIIENKPYAKIEIKIIKQKNDFEIMQYIGNIKNHFKIKQCK